MVLRFKKIIYFCTASGEMAEWSNAAVLKTVVPRGTGGSNPSLSAKGSSDFTVDLSFFYPVDNFFTGRPVFGHFSRIWTVFLFRKINFTPLR